MVRGNQIIYNSSIPEMLSSYEKRLFLFGATFICFSIFLFLKLKFDDRRFPTKFFPRRQIVYRNFTCNTSNDFSYLNLSTYQKCLKSKPDGSFWSVQGLRHTSYQNLLNSSSLIVEVGGNRGDDTTEFIKLYNPFIISFEPIPEMSEKLIQKFKANGKVEIRRYGLGNRARNLSVELFDFGNAGTSIFRSLSSSNSSKVRQIQLLDVIKVIEDIRNTRTRNGIIDMISINCEGCEFEILPALILNNMTQYFRIIQFGSHTGLLRESSCVYCQIDQALERTHQIKFHYTKLWEGWIPKNSTRLGTITKRSFRFTTIRNRF